MDKHKIRKPLIDYLLPDERRDQHWKAQKKNLKSGGSARKYTDSQKIGLAQGAKNVKKDKNLQATQPKEIVSNKNMNIRNNVEAKDIFRPKNLLRPSKSLTNILDESNNDDEELIESNNSNKWKSFEVNQQTRNLLRPAQSSMNILLDEYDYEVHEAVESQNINESRSFEVSQSIRRKNVLKSAKDFMDMLQESGTLESTYTNERKSIEAYQSIPPEIELRPAKSLMNMLDEHEISQSKNVDKRKSLDAYQPIQTKIVLRPASSLMNMLHESEIPESKKINVRRREEHSAKIVLGPAESSMNVFQESEKLESNKRRSLYAHQSIPTKNLTPQKYLSIESEMPETNHNISKETIQDNQLHATEPTNRLMPLNDPYKNYVKEPKTNNLNEKNISLQKNVSQSIPLHEKSTTRTLDESFHKVNDILESQSVFRSEISHNLQTEQKIVRPIPAKRLINALHTSNSDVKELNKFNDSSKIFPPITKPTANLVAKLTAKPTFKPTLPVKPIAKLAAKTTHHPTAKPRDKLIDKPIANPTVQPIPAKRMNIPNKLIYAAQEPNKTFIFSQRNVPVNRRILNESKYGENKTKEANNTIKQKSLEDESARPKNSKSFDIVEEANRPENKKLEIIKIREVDSLPEVKLTRQINVGKSSKLVINISGESKSDLKQTQDVYDVKQCVALETSQIKTIRSLEIEEESISKALDEAFKKVEDSKESSNIMSIKTEQANASISIQTNVLGPGQGLFVKPGEEEDELIIMRVNTILPKAFQDSDFANPMSKQITVQRDNKSFINVIDGKEYVANKSFVQATNSLTRYQSTFSKKRKDIEASDKLFQLQKSVSLKTYEKKPTVLDLGKHVIKEYHSPLKLEEQSHNDNGKNIGDSKKLFNDIQGEKSENKNHTDEEKIKEYFSSWNHKIKNVNPRESKYIHKDTVTNLNSQAFVPLGRVKSELDLLDTVDLVNNKFSRKIRFGSSSESILSESVSMESIAESFRIPRVSSYNRARYDSANVLSDERKSSIYMDDSAEVSEIQ